MSFLGRHTAEWDHAWVSLGAHLLNKGIDDPCASYNQGETWQYMGTVNRCHEFRHRMHPTTGNREVVRLPVSTETENA